MAKDRTAPQQSPLWGLRMVEWSLLAGVIVVLALVFARQVRVLQGQAELAAVRSTLGALRTALVIDDLKQKVAGKSSSASRMQRNPFEMLQRNPVTYRGVMTSFEAASVPAGSWVFEPVCACVGYVPMDDQWFESPSGQGMAWYQLSSGSWPVQLTAKEAYIWQGHAMN